MCGGAGLFPSTCKAEAGRPCEFEASLPTTSLCTVVSCRTVEAVYRETHLSEGAGVVVTQRALKAQFKQNEPLSYWGLSSHAKIQVARQCGMLIYLMEEV